MSHECWVENNSHESHPISKVFTWKKRERIILFKVNPLKLKKLLELSKNTYWEKPWKILVVIKFYIRLWVWFAFRFLFCVYKLYSSQGLKLYPSPWMFLVQPFSLLTCERQNEEFVRWKDESWFLTWSYLEF